MYLFFFTKQIKLLIIIVISLWLTACKTHRFLYYTPTPNNPTFEKKGDSKISTEVSGNILQSVESVGGVFQGAYAVTNHLAVGYSYDFRNENTLFANIPSPFIGPAEYNYFNSSRVITSRNAHEFCIGYFTCISRSRRSNIYYSTYAGYGTGKFDMKESGIFTDTIPYERHQNGTINKFFVQPAVYFKHKAYFTLALITKFSGFKYHFTENSYTNEEKDFFKMNVNGNDLFCVVEPTVMISAGMRNIHFIFSITFTGFVSDKKLDPINNNASAGFIADITGLLKKK